MFCVCNSTLFFIPIPVNRYFPNFYESIFIWEFLLALLPVVHNRIYYCVVSLLFQRHRAGAPSTPLPRVLILYNACLCCVVSVTDRWSSDDGLRHRLLWQVHLSFQPVSHAGSQFIINIMPFGVYFCMNELSQNLDMWVWIWVPCSYSPGLVLSCDYTADGRLL